MAQMSTRLKMPMTRARSDAAGYGKRLAKASAMVMAAGLVLPLGACGVNRTLPPPIVAYDYHDRHPVVLADTEHMIDVFPPPAGRRLDSATAGRIRDFAARYHRLGHGQISVLAPVGGPDGAIARAGVDEVRRALSMAGVRGSVMVGTYPVSDPSLAAPIRLTFQGLKAKVAGRCGEWPADLAVGSALDGWQNKSYWNFGCASQTTLAAQVADPRDLASPRGETNADIEMRMRAIGKVRTGADPTTQWLTKATSISSIGGGN
jgi:pilus assembly protein CpaD